MLIFKVALRSYILLNADRCPGAGKFRRHMLSISMYDSIKGGKNEGHFEDKCFGPILGSYSSFDTSSVLNVNSHHMVKLN